MKKLLTLASLLVMASLVLAACGGGNASTASDLLGAIQERGYILVSTDPNYEPQSFLNTEGSRPSDTKCPADALTTAEMQGFDVDVAIAIGDGLGVETCFATPSWDAITAGNWADKWDVSVGSMTVTTDRQKILDFSVPYYYTPAVVAVAADSGITSVDGLSGQAVCAGCAEGRESAVQFRRHDRAGRAVAGGPLPGRCHHPGCDRQGRRGAGAAQCQRQQRHAGT